MVTDDIVPFVYPAKHDSVLRFSQSEKIDGSVAQASSAVLVHAGIGTDLVLLVSNQVHNHPAAISLLNLFEGQA